MNSLETVEMYIESIEAEMASTKELIATKTGRLVEMKIEIAKFKDLREKIAAEQKNNGPEIRIETEWKETTAAVSTKAEKTAKADNKPDKPKKPKPQKEPEPPEPQNPSEQKRTKTEETENMGELLYKNKIKEMIVQMMIRSELGSPRYHALDEVSKAIGKMEADYDVDSVTKEIEEKSELLWEHGEYIGTDEAIEIVKRGGKE